jgi:gliding motility-associated-like protein
MNKINIKNLVVILVLYSFSINSNAQKLIYQDYFRGSVEFFSLIGYDNSKIELEFNQSDSIYKVFLISPYTGSTSSNDNLNHIKDKLKKIKINDNQIYYDEKFQVSKNFLVNDGISVFGFANLRIVDITDNINNSSIQIETDFEFNYNTYSEFETSHTRYNFISILCLYKNSLFKTINLSLFSNDISIKQVTNQNFQLQKFNLLYDIGLSLNFDFIWGSHDKSTIIYNVADTLGDITNQSGECNVGNLALSGQFKYRDGELFGFCDDVANETMNDVDLLVNLKNKITSDEFFIQSVYTGQFALGGSSNPMFHSLLTYVTDCKLVDNQVSKDTALCINNNTVQLFATNGIAYEWEPKKGLSCYNCPNPVFNYDTSVYYTVKIWNTDSCFKVFPVQVRVIHPPSPEIDASTSVCGEANAGLIFNNLHPMFGPYQVDFNGEVSDKLVYQSLAAGTYPYTITNAFGCSFSDTLEILQVPIIANFEYQPQEASVPFEATFTNTSQNAYNYIWIVEGNEFFTENLNYTFTEAETYPVTLIAYLNGLECSDTVTYFVNGLEWFSVLIPNVFTPNGDGTNDEFTFEASRIRSAEWEIFNRWGTTLHTGEWKTEQAFFNDTHIIPVWNGITQRNEPAPEGVYFYKITVKTLNNVFETFTGNVTLLR